MELQREEEEYLDYIEQKKLATQKGQNPEEVQESFTAKDFEVVIYSAFLILFIIIEV